MGKRSKSGTAGEPTIEILAVGPTGDGAVDEELVPGGVAELVTAVSDAVVPAAQATGAAKFGVQFGVRIHRDGSASLAEDGDRTAFRVFLEWNGSQEA
ncbi:MAG: hypothetical protein U0869_07530 [Chloroflexota bacterium]